MSHDALPSSGPATEHSVAVPGTYKEWFPLP